MIKDERKSYPKLIDRVKAVTLDSLVMILFMIVLTYTFSMFEYVPDYTRLLALLFIFIFYEPIFVSAFGGTIGHFVQGMQVQSLAKSKKILFPVALIRFMLKTLLGWLSFITLNPQTKSITKPNCLSLLTMLAFRYSP